MMWFLEAFSVSVMGVVRGFCVSSAEPPVSDAHKATKVDKSIEAAEILGLVLQVFVFDDVKLKDKALYKLLKDCPIGEKAKAIVFCRNKAGGLEID